MKVIQRNLRRTRRAVLSLESCEARVLMATGPSLGLAASFAVLGSTTVTNTGATNVAGDVGVSPGTSITGFPPGIVVGTIHLGDPVATQAEADLAAAYNVLAGEAVDTNLTGQDLGGRTLAPGVYQFSTSAQLTGTLTLDALGDPNAVFVIRTGTTLTTATDSSVALIDGARAGNVFWQVGSSATIGTTTAFRGNILAQMSIDLVGGASLTSGRALAIQGAVTMDTNAISAPPPTISGTAFLDLNASGTVAAGDPGMAGRVVYVDLHADGTLHADDPQAVTDASGHFTIGGIARGQYTLRVKAYPNDDPTGGPVAVDTTAGLDLAGVNFGLQPGSTVVPRTPTPIPFAGGATTQGAVIESLYRTLLGRQGEQAGIDHWLAASRAGEANEAIAAQFLQSPEYQSNLIESYYRTFLGRAAEPAGLSSWMASLQSGWTDTRVAEYFLSSPEYVADHSAPSDFVQSLYANLVGRDATPQEISNWDQSLGAGMSRSTVAADMVESIEAYLRGIEGDYTAFLARVGEAPGVAHWLTLIQQGTTTLDGVEAYFFTSPEFVARA